MWLYCVVFTDVWSAGCVVAELLLGQPIFPGDSGVDQLVEIIKVLGTPSREQIREMNQNYQEFKFPQIKAHPWPKVSNTVVTFQNYTFCPLIQMFASQRHFTKMNIFIFLCQVFRPRTSAEAMDLVGHLLEYTPTRRVAPLEACVHPYFDELRQPSVCLPNGNPLPAMFNFSTAGSFYTRQHIVLVLSA